MTMPNSASSASASSSRSSESAARSSVSETAGVSSSLFTPSCSATRSRTRGSAMSNIPNLPHARGRWPGPDGENQCDPVERCQDVAVTRIVWIGALVARIAAVRIPQRGDEQKKSRVDRPPIDAARRTEWAGWLRVAAGPGVSPARAARWAEDRPPLHADRGLPAAGEARLDLARRGAAVAVGRVGVVAGLGGRYQAVAAGGRARRGRADARVAVLDGARCRAAVEVGGVAVVARLAAHDHAVPADRHHAGRGLSAAGVRGLDGARRRAAVAVDGVAVVAGLDVGDQAVAAGCGARRRLAGTGVAVLGRAERRAAVPRYEVTVVALLVGLHDAVAAVVPQRLEYLLRAHVDHGLDRAGVHLRQAGGVLLRLREGRGELGAHLVEAGLQ